MEIDRLGCVCAALVAGVAPPGFPMTVAAFKDLTNVELTALLHAYGQDVAGSKETKLLRLRIFLTTEL